MYVSQFSVSVHYIFFYIYIHYIHVYILVYLFMYMTYIHVCMYYIHSSSYIIICTHEMYHIYAAYQISVARWMCTCISCMIAYTTLHKSESQNLVNQKKRVNLLLSSHGTFLLCTNPSLFHLLDLCVIGPISGWELRLDGLNTGQCCSWWQWWLYGFSRMVVTTQCSLE